MAGIRKQWLDKVGDVTVERVSGVKRSGVTADLSVPPKGDLHTTEGGRASSISVFTNSTGTPTFGAGRAEDGKLHVDQFMPIGEMALTLQNDAGGTETNRECRVQIEVYAFSRQTTKPRWFLGLNKKEMDDATKNLLADLVYEASEAAGIPHRHAGKGFLNRSLSQWDTVAGWYGHSETPENDHWDPGTFDWADLFRRGERWEVWLITGRGGKDDVIAKSDRVRGNEVGSTAARFIAARAAKFSRLLVTGKRPRIVRRRVR